MLTTESPVSEERLDVAEQQDVAEEKSGPTFEVLAVLAFVLALVAVIIAAFGMALAARAVDEHRSTPMAGPAAGAATAVSLDEFTISPSPLSVAVGGSVRVANEGAIQHDLAVEGADLATPELSPGEGADLDLSGLPPGTYTVYCQIAGHRQAGMEADLTIG